MTARKKNETDYLKILKDYSVIEFQDEFITAIQKTKQMKNKRGNNVIQEKQKLFKEENVILDPTWLICK